MHNPTGKLKLETFFSKYIINYLKIWDLLGLVFIEIAFLIVSIREHSKL
jgi:hypothetical protein